MLRGIATPTRNVDVGDHVLNLLRGIFGKGLDGKGHREVDQHADEADAFGRDAQYEWLHVCELDGDDVEGGKSDAGQHARDGGLAVHLLGEDADE